MSSMVEELIGNEEVMMNIAAAHGKEYKPTLEKRQNLEEEKNKKEVRTEDDSEEDDYR
jgi:ribosomal protein L12E/L44/L45/RPP1/RPP2